MRQITTAMRRSNVTSFSSPYKREIVREWKDSFYLIKKIGYLCYVLPLCSSSSACLLHSPSIDLLRVLSFSLFPLPICLLSTTLHQDTNDENCEIDRQSEASSPRPKQVIILSLSSLWVIVPTQYYRKSTLDFPFPPFSSVTLSIFTLPLSSIL